MNKQIKGYSIILYLLWPFSVLLIGIRHFDSLFGKKLIIALYAFLGFTAFSVGDLERYESVFYVNKNYSLGEIFNRLTSLQTGKFYNDFLSVLSGFVFESHHYYFLILYLVYGYLYIHTVNKLKEISLKKLNIFGLVFFLGILLFLLVRPIYSVAFYTGGVFVLYHLASYHKNNNRKHLLYLLLAPLFHIGLTICLIIPGLLLIFKNKTWRYVLFVLLTFFVGQSSVVRTISTVASVSSGTIIEEKYKAYADEDGRASLDERYAENSANNNIKARILITIQGAIWYLFIPLGMFLLFLKRSMLLVNQKNLRLFHIVLLFWGISNLMLNISQGERFVALFSFMAVGLFFSVYASTKDSNKNTSFTKFLYVFVPFLFVYGLMLAYASNEMFINSFFISNFFIEIFNHT